MVEGYQQNTFRDPGMTRGRQADLAEQGMLGLSNFMAMGGNFNDFLVRMAPQRALGNLSDPDIAKDIAKLQKAGRVPGFLGGNQLPSAFASSALSPKERAATMKSGATRVAGMKRIPIAGGVLQAVQGDPIGGFGYAGGGLLAQAALRSAPPIVRIGGTILGGMLGSRATQAVAGINPNDPYSGPDITIPGTDIPLSPYADTKRRAKRMRELRKEDLEQAQEFQRKQMAMQLANSLLMGQQQISGTLANTMLQTSPFGR
jgi:hypothetical protein